MNPSNVIKPNWPAPANIQAFTTLRHGGVSHAPYHSFNFGEYVGDNPVHVEANRNLLKKSLNLPAEPVWLKQVHSTIVLPALAANMGQEADASFSLEKNQVCVVTTEIVYLFCFVIVMDHRWLPYMRVGEGWQMVLLKIHYKK